MRAVVLREFGPPAGLVVDRLPGPVPGPGEALVEVELASVTRFCSFGMAGGAFSPISDAVATDFGVAIVRGLGLTPARQRELSELSERALVLAAAGRLCPVVGKTFALHRASDAHAAIESRTTIGKTLLVV